MKDLHLLLAVLLFVVISACTMSEQQQNQWKQTGSLVASKAAQIATRTVLNVAISQFDKEKKEGWLDSLAYGLRTEMPNLVTGEDIKKLIGVWTPNKPHWHSLGTALADAYEVRRTGDPERDFSLVESFAMGLNNAAAK